MRVGFGFSSVTFRPSRVYLSRVFSHPSVDTDEQSTGSCQNFHQTFKMLGQILRADNVFVYAFISLLYKQFLQYTMLNSFTVPYALLTKFPKKFHTKLVASTFIFIKLSTTTVLLWRRCVSFEYQGLLQNTPASFLLVSVNVQASS